MQVICTHAVEKTVATGTSTSARDPRERDDDKAVCQRIPRTRATAITNELRIGRRGDVDAMSPTSGDMSQWMSNPFGWRKNLVKEEEQVVAQFLGVLKPEISNIVSLQPYWTYMDICCLALMVEKNRRLRVPLVDFPHYRKRSLTAPRTTLKATTSTTSAIVGLGIYASELCLNSENTGLRYLMMQARFYDTDATPEFDEPANSCVLLKKYENISEAPLQVQPLLREFTDVILYDIPLGLPAMRHIQHCIDFIPGFNDGQWRFATLPFAFGGLGVYSASDVLIFVFLASGLQFAGLQTKLLQDTSIVAARLNFDDALSVFNKYMETDLLSNSNGLVEISKGISHF
ncbi:hypothetical protein Tco_1404248 [Tanacetum coccineum]